ncbi:LysR family transcriptional regulator [Salinicoccus luteus]|uniref:LysR family transcriptional regulator n=1 Tax=Salinicoccus luteus TaxID=367840 RepID=UPI0004E0D319|nr:LysR family transcriptional regulator [Salinicoccus luteus]
MNFKDWIILETISKEGNISRASKKIYLTQPAVTKRIQQLEKELDVNILYRTNRGSQLTPQGEFLANKASRIIKKVESIENGIQRMNESLSGTIKISASNFMMRYRLPAVLSGFKEKYPKVEFKVETGWSQDMLKKLQNDEVDIAFVRGDYTWREGKHLLFEEPMCIASMKPLDLGKLPEAERVDYRTDYKLHELIDRWWMQNYSQTPNISIVVSRTDICREMVASGLGYAILPKFVVEDVPGMHINDIFDEDNQLIVRHSWMFYSKKTENIKIVKTFIEYLSAIDFSKKED